MSEDADGEPSPCADLREIVRLCARRICSNDVTSYTTEILRGNLSHGPEVVISQQSRRQSHVNMQAHIVANVTVQHRLNGCALAYFSHLRQTYPAFSEQPRSFKIRLLRPLFVSIKYCTAVVHSSRCQTSSSCASIDTCTSIICHVRSPLLPPSPSVHLPSLAAHESTAGCGIVGVSHMKEGFQHANAALPLVQAPRGHAALEEYLTR